MVADSTADDINTNESYPLTAAMKRQRALPSRAAGKKGKAKLKALEVGDEDSSSAHAAKEEKGKLVTQALMKELLASTGGERPMKRQKKEDEGDGASEGGGESVDPDDEQDDLDATDDEGEGKKYVLSRYFDPTIKSETATPSANTRLMPHEAILSAEALEVDLVSSDEAPHASRPDLQRPSDLDRYVANDPLGPGHDNSSSVLPYSSPIDRKISRHDSNLVHPQPKHAWPKELEKLKRAAAKRAEELEREKKARVMDGEEDEVRPVMRKGQPLALVYHLLFFVDGCELLGTY